VSYTIKNLQTRFKELNYQWPSFHLIGIRSKNYVPNKFCDTFILINGSQAFWFKGTTRPGSYYLLNLLNPKGTAILKLGQYIDTWTLGLHRGKYKAWVQVKPVTVFRDKDKDIYAEPQGTPDKGLFGINIHRANQFTVSSLVDKHGAGCQVFDNPENFAKFVELSEQSKQKFFTYTLIEEF